MPIPRVVTLSPTDTRKVIPPSTDWRYLTNLGPSSVTAYKGGEVNCGIVLAPGMSVESEEKETDDTVLVFNPCAGPADSGHATVAYSRNTRIGYSIHPGGNFYTPVVERSYSWSGAVAETILGAAIIKPPYGSYDLPTSFILGRSAAPTVAVQGFNRIDFAGKRTGASPTIKVYEGESFDGTTTTGLVQVLSKIIATEAWVYEATKLVQGRIVVVTVTIPAGSGTVDFVVRASTYHGA